MRDVHALAPETPGLPLHQVGLGRVKKPISVNRAGRVVTLSAIFAVAVDLPMSRKGSDLSRNAEVLAEVLDRSVHAPVPSLEAACSDIARELLARHPYASRSRVTAEADYYLPRGGDHGRPTLEDFKLFAGSTATRGATGDLTLARSIGAEAVGMTACPCAMESCRAQLIAEFPALAGAEWATFPMVTHNQRNRTRLTLEVPSHTDVEADHIIEAIEAAQSAPTYSILKRDDEARVVLAAHRNPKFVEDVLRDLLASVPARFPHLPDDAGVLAETVSEESIHKYDVVAEHRSTVGDLRALRG